jgi:hypothetical protein
LPHCLVPFAEALFHIIVKLLQITFFRGSGAARFVGKDECYTYARRTERDYYYCVRVELKGAPATQETDPVHAFRVIPHATRLGRADLTKTRPSDALFGKRTAGDRFHFLQLRSGQAESEPSVYHIVKYPDRRAHVKYHDPRHLDASRGKILYDFVQSFLEYLRALGITGHNQQRLLTQL